MKLTHVEKELKEWVQIAQDHCLPNTLVSPIALRSRIEQLLQKDVITAAENSSHTKTSKSLEEELRSANQVRMNLKS